MDTKLLSKIVADTIRYCYVHPVTFQMVFKKFYIEAAYEENDNIKQLVDSLTWDSLVFAPNITTLTVFTQQTGSDDVRGGGCGDLEIPVQEFRYSIVNSTGITLKNLTEAVYRMKGSKYDWSYEELDKIKCTFNGDNVVVEAKFSYGS